MATIEVSAPELLKAVRQLPPDELDAFLEKALLLRHQPTANKLSAEESRLIKAINRGLPEAMRRRYALLSQKRKRNSLSDSEHAELLKLTHEFENRDADRAAALLDLATLRRVPIRLLMKQMGIKAAPVHG
jgi:predicted DNA-binding transcriptional regulator YafY